MKNVDARHKAGHDERESTATMQDLMKGKRGLIMGVANDHSIAWGIAKTLAAHGAELVISTDMSCLMHLDGLARRDDVSLPMMHVAEVLAARQLLCRGFEKLGIRYVPSSANFVLGDFGKRAIEVRDALRGQGILVRDRSYEAPGCVRITVGTREQTQRLLDALEQIWRQ